MNEQELYSFLSKAHKNTYAAHGVKASSLRPQSSDYHFEEGEFSYHDTYFGDNRFIGEEIVYFQSEPVWGMNYYGYVIDDSHSPKELFGFLRKALLVDTSASFRGPQEYNDLGLTYENSMDGDIKRFAGKEQIKHKDQIIYEAIYHGGYIIGREQA
jgi:hypothetical protein